MQPEDLARYWGILNRFRRIAEDVHATGTKLNASVEAERNFALGMLGGGTLWMLGSAAVAYRSPIVLVALEAIGIVFVVVGVKLAIGWRRFAESRAPYAAREHRREGYDDNGVVPAAQFLIEHWPDRAPELLLFRQSREEHRLSLVSERAGRPLLVQILDVAEPPKHMKPPVLTLLVASPMDPGATGLDETESGRALIADGFRLGWTHAGAFAIHYGPASLSKDDIDRAADALAAVALSSKGAEPLAPIEPEIADDASTIELFLEALRDRDHLGALAHTDPLIFGGPLEPAPEDLERLVDNKRLRPLSWKATGNKQSVNDNDCLHTLTAELDGRTDKNLHVYVTKRVGAWLVRGLSTDAELLVGFDFDALRI